MFQSTHLHEVWHQKQPNYKRYKWFQSTHLHEVWPCRSNTRSAMPSFNPHTYMRCDKTKKQAENYINSFNPHTYMRCDLGDVESSNILCVSIHTPTWGVTRHLKRKLTEKLFQSTHLHEVWHVVPLQGDLLRSFNPHTYMRCDIKNSQITRDISGFNPHTYMRCDLLGANRLRYQSEFQSTHLHEVWLLTT